VWKDGKANVEGNRGDKISPMIEACYMVLRSLRLDGMHWDRPLRLCFWNWDWGLDCIATGRPVHRWVRRTRYGSP
jgi:hypothetical protein